MVMIEHAEVSQRTQFSRSDKIEQNHDFCQNSKIFFVLTAVNTDKRFLRPLGVVGDVLCVFCATAPAVSCAKRQKSRKIHSKKKDTNEQNLAIHDFQTTPTWGRPQPLQGWF